MKKKKGFILKGIFFLFFSFLSFSAHSEWLSPLPIRFLQNTSATWEWKTRETPHFRITYPAGLREIAKAASLYLEEAHQKMAPLFKWTSPSPVQVILLDNADSANGMAVVWARVGLILRVVLPESYTNLSGYDDWLKLLIFHEYTHYLNIDTTYDFWAALRWLWGPQLLPNALWPSWMLEGLAVHMETRFTRAGRGRSTDYQTSLRIWTKSQFPEIDELDLSQPHFPNGDIVYQMGYHLMTFAERRGLELGRQETLGALSQKSASGNPIALNTNLKRLINTDWMNLWHDWKSQTQRRVESDLKQLEAIPVTPHQILLEQNPRGNDSVRGVAASEDGQWLAYTLYSSDDQSRLYLKKGMDSVAEPIDEKYSGSGMTFTPDAQFLIYSSIDLNGDLGEWSDLKAYSLKTKNIQFLSRSQRFKDPHLSPDGKWLTFTQVLPGKTALLRAPLRQKEDELELGPVEVLWTPQLFERVANPHYSRKGDCIYFSFHPHQKAQEDILSYDLKTGQVRTLVSQGAMNRFPITHSQGDLYFISNQSGIDRLYWYDEKKETSFPVSHFLTGIDFPTFSFGTPSVLYASIPSSSGLSLVQIRAEDLKIQAEYEKLSSPPLPPDSSQLPELSFSSFPSEEKAYSPFPSLLPRIWSPLFGSDPRGFQLGAGAYGWDAIEEHQYLVQGLYHFENRKGDVMLDYTNRSFPWTLQFTGFSQHHFFYQNSALQSGGYIERTVQSVFQSSSSYPFGRATLKPSLALMRIQKQKASFLNPTSFFYSRSFLAVDMLLNYVNTRFDTYRFSIHAERGEDLSLGVRLPLDSFSSVLGPQWVFRGLKNIPLGKHTVLMPLLYFSVGSSVSLQGQPTHFFPSASSRSLFVAATRGYPFLNVTSSWAGKTSLDLFFPIAQIFRGWKTYPLFMKNISGFVYLESAATFSAWFPSSGLGLQFFPKIFYHAPIQLSLEYQQGWNSRMGGGKSFLFQMQLAT